MKALLLAGGLGTRMREETEYRPKPMVEIGGRPVIWHIMKVFAASGISDFVVASGYKSEVIKDYFLNYEGRNNDFTVTLGADRGVTYHGSHEEESWRVTVAYTGEATLTGGRVHQAAKYVGGSRFLCTYGDGLADIDIADLIRFHKAHRRLATVTTVQPTSRFGVMDIDADGSVSRFREKPTVEGWINVGFFVFEPQVLDYITPESVLEEEPLARLAEDGQLVAYRHTGFWQPMDTYREWQALNAAWEEGRAPWRVW